MEAIVAGRRIDLAAAKRRAVLALLTLHVGQTVTVWQFKNRMWDIEPPRTAQWALRNQISALRKEMQGDPGVRLKTVPAGYSLQAAPEAVDHQIFRRLASEGRKLLESGDAEAATQKLARALSVWHGPALANVRDAWETWPEARGLEEMRLRTVEDRIDADLLLGRHRRLVAELEGLTRSSPWRERLWRQHMVALFRSGQQARALAAYRDARAALAEGGGREPGKALEDVYRAILEQRADFGRSGMPGTADGGETDPSTDPPPVWPIEVRRMDGPVTVGSQVSSGAPSRGGWAADELRPVTILTLRVCPAAAPRMMTATGEPYLDAAVALITERVVNYGGRIEQAVGSVVSASFGLPRGHQDDCERAIRAALDVRRDLQGGTEAMRPVGQEPSISAAITAGTLLIRNGAAAGRPKMVGRAVDECVRLIDRTPDGEIRVADPVYWTTHGIVAYQRVADDDHTWTVQRLRDNQDEGRDARRLPLMDRARELATLREILHTVRATRRPYMITVVGAPGIGKTRLVEELREGASADPPAPRWYRASVPPFGESSAAHVIATLEPIADADGSASQGLEKLVSSLLNLADTSATAEPHRLIDWTMEFRRALAQGSPATTVLVFEDLHRADSDLLRFIERLPSHAGWARLIVIATASPELLAAQPGWGGGRGNSLTLTLAPLAGGYIVRLLSTLFAEEPSSAGSRPLHAMETADVLRATDLQALMRIGGNPLFAVEYGRRTRNSATAPRTDAAVRDLDYRLVGERLDAVTPDASSILRAAAVFGTVFRSDGAATLAGIKVERAAGILAPLEEAGLVLSVGPSLYAFVQPQLRDVVYQRIPRSAHGALHSEAADWISDHMPPSWATVAQYHQRLATRSSQSRHG